MTEDQEKAFQELVCSILDLHPFYGKRNFGVKNIPMWRELPWTPEQIVQAVKRVTVHRYAEYHLIEDQLSQIEDIGDTGVRVYGNLIMLSVLADEVFSKMFEI